MAQDGSFLYRLKLELDSGGAASQLKSQMGEVSASIAEVGERTDMLERKIKRSLGFQDFDFDTPLRRFNQIGQSAVKSFTRAREELYGLASRMNRDLEEMVENTARLETAGGQAFSQLRQSGSTQSAQQQRFRQQTPSLASGASRQLSQNFRQIREELTNLEGRGSASVSQLANQFTGLNSDVSSLQKNLSTLMGNLEATGQSLKDLSTDNPFDHLEEGARRVPRAINEVRQEILESESSLEEMAVTADRSWGRVTNGALEAADGAERMGASIMRSAERAESSLKGMRKQIVRSRGATFSLGSTASSAASQLSIDLTQSAQDAAFGIENLAASAPFLQEQFGRVQREAGTFTGALKDIGNALMGPTGVIAAFTLLLTFHEEIVGFFTNIERHLGQIGVIDFTETEESIASLSDALDGLREDASDAAKILQNINDEGKEFFEGVVETEKKDIRQQFQTLRDEIASFEEETGADLSILQQEGDESLTEFAKRMDNIASTGGAEEVNQIAANLAETARRAEQANLTMKVLNDEQVQMREEARRIAEESKGLFTFQEALKGLRMGQQKANDETEKQNELLLDQLDIRQKLRDEFLAQVDEESGTLVSAVGSTARDFAERREKIKEQFQEQRNTVKEELEKGSDEYQTKMADINEREIRALTSFEYRRMQALSNAREEALSEVAQDTMIEAEEPEFMENPLLVNGEFVERSKFVDEVNSNFKEAQRRIQSELEALRFERESGVRVGDLMGDSMFGGAAGAAAQRENLKKRFAKRRELVREEQEKMQRLFFETGKDKYAQKWADLEKKRTRLTKQEAQKRLQINLQTMRQIGTAIESSPIGNATSNLITDLGALWQAHYENQINWEQKNNKEKAAMITSVGSQVVGAASTIAQQTFQSWKSTREKELKQEGKTAEERRKILKKEGKKRFRIMKATKITEASINTAAGVTRALAELPPPASYAAAAATAAAGLFRVKQIAGMSIGDRIGGGGGGGSRGGQFTQRAAASSATAAGRVGTAMEASRNNDEDKIKKTAERVGQEVGRQMPDSVTMDDDTAEQANDVAVKQKNKLNK